MHRNELQQQLLQCVDFLQGLQQQLLLGAAAAGSAHCDGAEKRQETGAAAARCLLSLFLSVSSCPVPPLFAAFCWCFVFVTYLSLKAKSTVALSFAVECLDPSEVPLKTAAGAQRHPMPVR